MRTQKNLLPRQRVNLIKLSRKKLIIGDGVNQTTQRSRKKKKKSSKKRSNGLLLMLTLRLKPSKKKMVSEVLITNLNKSKRR